MRIHCDAKCDSAGVRIRQHGAAQNDRTRCHHSGCSGFFETCDSYQNWPAAGCRPKKQPAGAMDGPAGVKAAGCRTKKARRGLGWPGGREEVAGTGTEQTRFRSGKQGGRSSCDAKCDAISADRIELLARAVVLVAGMRIPEAAREAVLARVTAELANAAEQSPRKSARAGESTGR
jgi:hypothetical protein